MGWEKKTPPQKGAKKASGRENEAQGQRDVIVVGENNRVIYIYFFSISLNVPISAFSTRTRIPESSPVETGISTDKNICFPNRRAVRKSLVSSNVVYLVQLTAHPVSSLSKGPRPRSMTAAADFPSLAVSNAGMKFPCQSHPANYALSTGA